MGTTTNALLNSGLIKLLVHDNNPAATVFNGANVLPSSGGIGFFVTFQLPGNDVVRRLARDGDQGAPTTTTRHMVRSLTNGGFSVPDGGATLSLLGGALMGLGLLRRRLSL